MKSIPGTKVILDSVIPCRYTVSPAFDIPFAMLKQIRAVLQGAHYTRQGLFVSLWRLLSSAPAKSEKFLAAFVRQLRVTALVRREQAVAVTRARGDHYS